ncbi:MAG TPA: LapA family protein [Xanthobacteraceae bacterium]|nr:LapA family protein [Xanthobacteraceae bacterium]
MTGTPHSASGTLRKVVAVLILVPLAIVIIAFAVANRQDVTISLDPFGPNASAPWQTQPLFVVLIAALILGVIVGGTAAWLRQTKWRRTARRLEREAAALRAEIDTLKRAGAPVSIPPAVEPAERLQLRPPLH